MTMLILVTTNPNTFHSVLWWDTSIIENHSSMASQAKKKKFNPVVQIEREREREIQQELDVVMEKLKSIDLEYLRETKLETLHGRLIQYNILTTTV